MQPPAAAASMIIWHASIFSYVFCQDGLLVYLHQEGEKGHWVAKQEAGKINFLSNNELVLFQWDTSCKRKWSGTNRRFCVRRTIHRRFWKRRKSGLWSHIRDRRISGSSKRFTGFGVGQFGLCLSIPVSRWYLGQIFSFSEWLPPQLGRFRGDVLHSLYLCSPPQIEQRCLRRKWLASCR